MKPAPVDTVIDYPDVFLRVIIMSQDIPPHAVGNGDHSLEPGIGEKPAFEIQPDPVPGVDGIHHPLPGPDGPGPAGQPFPVTAVTGAEQVLGIGAFEALNQVEINLVHHAGHIPGKGGEAKEAGAEAGGKAVPVEPFQGLPFPVPGQQMHFMIPLHKQPGQLTDVLLGPAVTGVPLTDQGDLQSGSPCRPARARFIKG